MNRWIVQKDAELRRELQSLSRMKDPNGQPRFQELHRLFERNKLDPSYVLTHVDYLSHLKSRSQSGPPPLEGLERAPSAKPEEIRQEFEEFWKLAQAHRDLKNLGEQVLRGLRHYLDECPHSQELETLWRRASERWGREFPSQIVASTNTGEPQSGAEVKNPGSHEEPEKR
jgi:hypothetical protein